MVELNRGSFLTGRKKLAKELGMTEKEIRLRMDILEKDGFMAIKKTNKYSILTLCNYSTYQAIDDTKGPSEGPTEGQQRATFKNDKNEKEEDIKGLGPRSRLVAKYQGIPGIIPPKNSYPLIVNWLTAFGEKLVESVLDELLLKGVPDNPKYPRKDGVPYIVWLMKERKKELDKPKGPSSIRFVMPPKPEDANV